VLLYHGYIENVLREFDEEQIDEITEEFVLEEIEKSAKLKEKEQERIIKEKEEEFYKRLEEEITKKEQEKEEEWAKNIEKIKNSLRESAENEANKKAIFISWTLSIITGLIIGFLIYVGYLWSKKIDFNNSYFPLLAIIVGGSGIVGIITKFRRWLYEKFKKKLEENIYKQKLKETRLNEKN